MTQVKCAQDAGKKLASTPRARHRTLAQRRADLETQIRASIATDSTLALTEPSQVRTRMKQLRKLAGNPSQRKVALALNDTPPRTFQSWENAEVETDKSNYEMVARYYSKKLGRKITANWILFGHDHAPPLPKPATPDMGSVNGNMPDDLQRQLAELDAKLDLILHVLREDLPDALTAAVEEVLPKPPKRSTSARGASAS